MLGLVLPEGGVQEEEAVVLIDIPQVRETHTTGPSLLIQGHLMHGLIKSTGSLCGFTSSLCVSVVCVGCGVVG